MKSKESEFILTPSSGNVFDDLNVPAAEEYVAKAELAQEINFLIQQRKFTQVKAAELLGIDQPKVSALSRGQLTGFSLERLIGFLTKLDRDVKIVVCAKPKRRKGHGHLKTSVVAANAA